MVICHTIVEQTDAQAAPVAPSTYTIGNPNSSNTAMEIIDARVTRRSYPVIFSTTAGPPKMLAAMDPTHRTPRGEAAFANASPKARVTIH